MKRSLALCMVLLTAMSTVSTTNRSKRQVNSGPTSFCYYATWAKYTRLGPTAIDPFICTHIVLAFAEVQISSSTADLVAFDRSDENDVYPAMVDLKAQNPNLQVLLAVGGWNHGTDRFVRVADNPSLLSSFVRNTVNYLRKFSFDGLDVDWEFPTSKPQFTRFIKALRDEFDRPQNFDLLLTSAMSAGEATIISGYDIPALAPMLDYMLLMSYDLHGGWEGKTGHNSPLFAAAGETSWRARLNTAWAAQEYANRGMPPSKIVIGMTTYARRFTMRDPNVNGLEAPAAWWNQILNYQEVCRDFLPGSRIVWDASSMAHYAIKKDLWLSFDSVDSIRAKTEWLMGEGYGGAMVWTLDQDDYSNQCGQGFYPLLQTMKRSLFGPDGGPPIPSFPGQLVTVTAGPGVTRTTRRTTTTAVRTTTRIPVEGAVDCSTGIAGDFPLPGRCDVFIKCANNVMFISPCPPGLFYDPAFNWCNFESQVKPNRPDCPWDSPVTTTRRTTRPPTTRTTTRRPFTTTTRRTTTRRFTTRRTTTRRTTRRTTTRRTTTRRTTRPTTRRTTRRTVTTRRTTTSPTPTAVGGEVDCRSVPTGNYAFRGDCTRFFQCVNNFRYVTMCPSGLLYDEVSKTCDWAFLVKRKRPECA